MLRVHALSPEQRAVAQDSMHEGHDATRIDDVPANCDPNGLSEQGDQSRGVSMHQHGVQPARVLLFVRARPLEARWNRPDEVHARLGPGRTEHYTQNQETEQLIAARSLHFPWVRPPAHHSEGDHQSGSRSTACELVILRTSLESTSNAIRFACSPLGRTLWLQHTIFPSSDHDRPDSRP